MTRDEARAIVGCRGKRYRTRMAKALCMHSWRNTPDDWRLLEALRTLGHKVTVEIPYVTGQTKL